MGKNSGLSKVARGVAFGDVSNSAIRNILTEVSKIFFEEFTKEDMERTMSEDFNWCCPYTGRYLKDEYDNKTGNYAADHIYPQNKEWCGLNVKGNLVLVDKVANSAKKGIDVETFMKDDSDFWRDLGVDKATRMKRLNAIKSFQKRNGYDSNTIRSIVSSILNNRYNEIRVEQEKCIEQIKIALNGAGVYSTVKASASKKTVAKAGGTRRKYTDDDRYIAAAHYLRKNVSLVEIEKACFGCENSGTTAKAVLNKLGIDTSRGSAHKALLSDIGANIDDEIAKATDPKFKETLEEIKKRGL